MSLELCVLLLLVLYGLLPPQEVIQPHWPSQTTGMEHGLQGWTCLVGDHISMRVMEQQVDNMQFLVGAILDLAKFL